MSMYLHIKQAANGRGTCSPGTMVEAAALYTKYMAECEDYRENGDSISMVQAKRNMTMATNVKAWTIRLLKRKDVSKAEKAMGYLKNHINEYFKFNRYDIKYSWDFYNALDMAISFDFNLDDEVKAAKRYGFDAGDK